MPPPRITDQITDIMAQLADIEQRVTTFEKRPTSMISSAEQQGTAKRIVIAGETFYLTADGIGHLDKVALNHHSPTGYVDVMANADVDAFIGRHSSVAHGMTDLLPTTAWGEIRNLGAGSAAQSGGMVMRGVSDNALVTGLDLWGVIGVADPTDATPALLLRGAKSDGGTGAAALGAAETVMEVWNYDTPVWSILGDGSSTISGSLQVNSIGVGIAPDATTIGKFYRDDASTASMVLLEQDGTGDGPLTWTLTGDQSYTMGIDNSSTGNPLRANPGATLGAANGWLMDVNGYMSIGPILPFTLNRLTVYSADTNSNNTRAILGQGFTTSTVLGTHRVTACKFEAHGYGSANNTGYVYGLQGFAYNRMSAGTLSTLTAIGCNYGNLDGAAHTTTLAKGLDIFPIYQVGTITTAYDVYIRAILAGGVVTNEWCIYSLHAAASLLSGDLYMRGDNVKTFYGAGDDASIYYDATNFIIDPDVAGSGIVMIGATGDNYIQATSIGLGVTPEPHYPVNILGSFTGTGSNPAGFYSIMIYTPSGPSARSIFGASYQAYLAGANSTSGRLVGSYSRAYLQGGSGNVGAVYGIEGWIHAANSTRVVTGNMALVYAYSALTGSAITVNGNCYQLKLDDYAAHWTAGGTEYGIYQGGASLLNVLEGQLSILTDSTYYVAGAGGDFGWMFDGTDSVIDYDLLGAGAPELLIKKNGALHTSFTNDGIELSADALGYTCGTDGDMKVYYSGVEGVINTALVAASDLDIVCGANKTLELQNVVYKDYNTGGIVLNPAPGKAPGQDEFKDNTGTDMGISTYAIGVGEALDGSVEVDHDYAEGEDLTPHAHWQGIAAPTGTDKMQLQLTYNFTRTGVVPTAPTVIVIEVDFDTQYEFMKSIFAAIDGSSLLIGDQFIFRLERIAASANEYGGDMLIATNGLHVPVNTLGSRQPLTK